MSRTQHLPVLVLSLCGVVLSAQTAESRENDPPADSVERLLILAPGGPVLIELTITAAGRPFRETLERRVREMLPLADSNKDGKATWNEALAEPRFTAFGRESFWASDSAAHRKRLVRWYDADRNGIITAAELRKMLVESWPTFQSYVVERTQPFQFQPDIRNLLDTDRDGRLSANEVDAAGRRLKSRDADDNDLLDFSELGLPRSFRGRIDRNDRFEAVNLLTSRCAATFTNMRTKYADSGGKIRAPAFAAFPEMFRSLDENRNGILEFREAARLNTIEPHLRVRVRVGFGETGRMKLTVDRAGHPKTVRRPLVEKVDDRFIFVARGCRFQIEPPPRPPRGVARSNYARRQIYLTTKVSKTPLYGTICRSGRRWLSLRDMRIAPKRLLSLDRNRNGAIDAAEMPTQVTIRFTLGSRPASRAARRIPRSTAAVARKPTPKWFAHMDKNGDGDVSLREFLGTPKQFRRLDTNRDGFIEPVEAIGAAKSNP